MTKHAQFALTTLCLILLLFVVFRAPKQVFPVKKTTILKNIRGQEKIIERKSVEIVFNQSKIEQMNRIIRGFEGNINALKQQRDTFLLVQNQDELIQVLVARDSNRVNIIQSQDTIIQSYRSIILKKDSLLTIQNSDNKRLKRQRNLLIVAGSVLGGLLLIK